MIMSNYQLLDNKTQDYVNKFKRLDEKISHFTDILGLLGWDQKTKAPKKGRPLFAKAIATLSAEAFSLSISEEMGKCLSELSQPEIYHQLDDSIKAAIRVRKRAYEKLKRIPKEEYQQYVILTTTSNQIWEEARANNNFSLFEKSLENIVEFKKKFADYYGYEGHPYNALLDEYEPDLTIEKLDPLFSTLKEHTIELLKRIQNSTFTPKKEIFEQEYEIDTQKKFNQYILPLLGYDMQAGRLDETVHPFAQPINTGDVRITTRYLKENVRSSLFGTIHEAGHGIYEQNINPEYEGSSIRRGASFGIHESQSRFMENMIGRSKPFWTYFYPKLQQYFPKQLKNVTIDDFYRAVNMVEPSYIRVEADELTYNLHIMIRYEIEKGLLDNSFKVKELPEVWNEKMKEYLGIVPPSDSLGVLQDVHWSFGGLGYFPSYTLGNLYAAQFLYTIKKQIRDFDGFIESGNIHKIVDWLKSNIHQYGKLYTAQELIVKVTGEELNANYLVQYLKEKFMNVYKLS
jgi:carboxypeptidase Taq